MNKRYLPGLLMILLASGCVGPGRSPGDRSLDVQQGRMQSMSGEGVPHLAGSWKLVSFQIQDSRGQTSYPFGREARGRLIYEADGRMAVQIMDPHRPRVASEDLLAASEAEVRAAFGGYVAYYGTYSVNPAEQTIIHHLEAALLPNWVGTDQRRHYEFDGKVLTLKGGLLLGGVQGSVSLVWERLP
jgi:hypothetical protein